MQNREKKVKLAGKISLGIGADFLPLFLLVSIRTQQEFFKSHFYK
jgi:hypothetical protein